MSPNLRLARAPVWGGLAAGLLAVGLALLWARQLAAPGPVPVRPQPAAAPPIDRRQPAEVATATFGLG